MISKKWGATLVLSGSIVLAGCQTKPEPKEVYVPPPPPPEKLVVHEISTELGSKRRLVSASVDFSNHTGRSLDYVMFKTRAYDTQGREIPALKSGKPNAWLRIAGPLNTGERTGAQRWDKVWASADISCFRIEGAELIFDDSSVEFFEMDQIEMSLATLQDPNCQLLDEQVATSD